MEELKINMDKLTCFKAYDVRGQLGEELNEDIAYRIGRAYATFLKPKTIAVGERIKRIVKACIKQWPKR